MLRTLSVGILVLISVITAPAETFEHLRSIDYVPYVPDARAVAMGGASAATSDGILGLNTNPAALPAAPAFELAASGVPAPGVYLDDGVAGTLWLGYTLGGWRISTGVLREGFGEDANLATSGDWTGPKRERLCVALARDAATWFGLEPRQWQLRLGAKYVGWSRYDANEQLYYRSDVDFGASLRRRLTDPSRIHLGWRAAAVLTSVADALNSAPTTQTSDLILAGAFELILPRDVRSDYASRPDRGPDTNRRHRHLDVIVSYEREEYLESPFPATHRFGTEVGIYGVGFVRAGWCYDSRGFADGASWGCGLSLPYFGLGRLRFDWARTRVEVADLFDEYTDSFAMSWYADELFDLGSMGPLF